MWQLTKKGEQYLTVRRTGGKIKPDGVGRLVIFDIPEKERRKRDAIRAELGAAGFRQLQKSVWYAEQPLPEDFLELLDALALKPHVHIFSIRQSGTISRS